MNIKTIREIVDECYDNGWIQKKDNVIYAKTLFKANAFIKWIKDEYEKDLLSEEEVEQFIGMVYDIITGSVKIKWKSGVPHVMNAQKQITHPLG